MNKLFVFFGVVFGVSLLWAGPSIRRLAESGSVNDVKAYLDAGNPVDGADSIGWTLLHHAAHGAQ
ncbi:MAG: hypothetical protein A2014_06200 [Spirochaetes bacterium GWF1_49_6]|nr:MAG: hypothetical protein A2014_06200 [Spirochaetes bacterium GWF1_49_6]